MKWTCFIKNAEKKKENGNEWMKRRRKRKRNGECETFGWMMEVEDDEGRPKKRELRNQFDFIQLSPLATYSSNSISTGRNRSKDRIPFSI